MIVTQTLVIEFNDRCNLKRVEIKIQCSEHHSATDIGHAIDNIMKHVKSEHVLNLEVMRN